MVTLPKDSPSVASRPGPNNMPSILYMQFQDKREGKSASLTPTFPESRGKCADL